MIENLRLLKRISDHPVCGDELQSDEIMDLSVPIIVGDFPYLVKYYGALHAEVVKRP